MTGHFLDQDFSANTSAAGYTPITGGTASPMQNTSTAGNQGYPAPAYPPNSGAYGQTFDGVQSHPKPPCAASQPHQNSYGQQSHVGNLGQYGGPPPQAHQAKGENASFYNPQGAIGPPMMERRRQVWEQHQCYPPPNQGYGILDGRQPQPQGYPSTYHEQGATGPHVPGQYHPPGAQHYHHLPPHDQGYGVPGEYQHQLREDPPMHFKHGAPEAYISGQSPPHAAQQHNYPPPHHNQAHGGYEQPYGGNHQQPPAQFHGEHEKEKHNPEMENNKQKDKKEKHDKHNDYKKDKRHREKKHKRHGSHDSHHSSSGYSSGGSD